MSKFIRAYKDLNEKQRKEVMENIIHHFSTGAMPEKQYDLLIEQIEFVESMDKFNDNGKD